MDIKILCLSEQFAWASGPKEIVFGTKTSAYYQKQKQRYEALLKIRQQDKPIAAQTLVEFWEQVLQGFPFDKETNESFFRKHPIVLPTHFDDEIHVLKNLCEREINWVEQKKTETSTLRNFLLHQDVLDSYPILKRFIISDMQYVPPAEKKKWKKILDQNYDDVDAVAAKQDAKRCALVLNFEMATASPSGCGYSLGDKFNVPIKCSLSLGTGDRF